MSKNYNNQVNINLNNKPMNFKFSTQKQKNKMFKSFQYFIFSLTFFLSIQIGYSDSGSGEPLFGKRLGLMNKVKCNGTHTCTDACKISDIFATMPSGISTKSISSSSLPDTLPIDIRKVQNSCEDHSNFSFMPNKLWKRKDNNLIEPNSYDAMQLSNCCNNTHGDAPDGHNHVKSLTLEYTGTSGNVRLYTDDASGGTGITDITQNVQNGATVIFASPGTQKYGSDSNWTFPGGSISLHTSCS